MKLSTTHLAAAAAAFALNLAPAQAAEIQGTHTIEIGFPGGSESGTVTPLQPGVDFQTTFGDFLFDWVDGDTFAFQYLLSGDTPGLFVDLSSLSFTPAGTSISGASLAGVTLDDVDMVDVGSLEDPTAYADYTPALGPSITSATDSVSVTFNGSYPAGLHGDQLVWVVDVVTQSEPTPGVPVPATLPLVATSLGLLAWSGRRRKRGGTR
jgi:hypothetical protein